MPSIQATLRDALGVDLTLRELVGTHIYPGEIPDDAEDPPWLYYAVPESSPFDELDDDGNQRVFAEVEFHAFAVTYADAKAIIDRVAVVLDTYAGGQISRAFWRGTSEQVEDEGHHHVARYQVWGSLAHTFAAAGSRARIDTGADSVTLTAGGHTLTLTSDGLLLDGVDLNDHSAFARLDQANTFTTGLQLIQGTVSCPATTGTAFPGERFGAGAAPSVTAGTVGTTAIGQSAGAGITSGAHNTLIGFQCAEEITTGSENTIIGSQIDTPADLSSSVVIGRAAVLTGASRTVVIGPNITVAHADCVAIGVLAVSTKANQFVLGRQVSCLTFTQLSSTDNRPCAELQREWADSTDATRSGRLLLGSYYTTTFQEGVRVEANTAGVRLGFFGQAAVARPTVSGDTAGNAALQSLLAALESLGLITDSTT